MIEANLEERRKIPMKKLLSVLLVVVMLMGLSVTVFAAGVDSPDNAPPVMEDKDVKGEGETKDGTKVAVETLDPKKLPESFPFEDADKAVEDAVASETIEAFLEEIKVKVADITGTSLLAVTLEGAEEDEDAVVVLFYGKDGKPVAGAYFYEDAWYPITVEAGEKDGEYVLTFELGEDEKGLEADVTVTVETKE